MIAFNTQHNFITTFPHIDTWNFSLQRHGECHLVFTQRKVLMYFEISQAYQAIRWQKQKQQAKQRSGKRSEMRSPTLGLNLSG